MRKAHILVRKHGSEVEELLGAPAGYQEVRVQFYGLNSGSGVHSEYSEAELWVDGAGIERRLRFKTDEAAAAEAEQRKKDDAAMKAAQAAAEVPPAKGAKAEGLKSKGRVSKAASAAP